MEIISFTSFLDETISLVVDNPKSNMHLLYQINFRELPFEKYQTGILGNNETNCLREKAAALEVGICLYSNE